MKLSHYLTRVIEYSFYSLFLLVPLVFSELTSELFEFNKMWLTFGLTIIITTAWIAKMIVEKKIYIRRTPLDIPIMLFFLSQSLATLISLDPHVSWWGYYSRFNGGLYSTISYIILYYAFVSNLSLKHVMRSLKVTLASGLLTALWGFPAHFGYDPTCYVFRGTLDTSCWTESFKPTVRTFSTLGQPAWFAAYLAILIPLGMSFALKQLQFNVKFWSFFALIIFFYVSLIFTDTRAGFIGFWVANLLFWTGVFLQKTMLKRFVLKTFVSFMTVLILASFVLGSPVGQFKKYTLPELLKTEKPKPQVTTTTTAPAPAPEAINITDSLDIRIHVWNGALNAWRNNALIGTGVETFAFAYYKYKPLEHNLTSEWDYLYNKAHNEYLNYLATTGAFGLGTYLVWIGLFLFLTTRHVITLWKAKAEAHKTDRTEHELFSISLVAGFVSILITNLLGFSVVITNLYLFLIPVFIFILSDMLKEKSITYTFSDEKVKQINPYQWTALTLLIIISGWLITGLIRYHQADIAYALGNNLNKSGNYGEASPQLIQAYQIVPNEPTYKDELSVNLAAIAANLAAQKNPQAAQAAQQAAQLSTEVVTEHPNNVVYWKNRVRVFFTLSSSDKENAGNYIAEAIKAIDTAKTLAPTDVKVAYNQGILYGQIGQYDKATALLEETLKLKPNYKDAYVALGLLYHQAAIDKDEKVVNPEKQKKAIEAYQYILDKISPNDAEVKKTLKEWQ